MALPPQHPRDADPSPFRPLTLAELLRAALRLYGATVVPAVPIALVLSLPLLIVSGIPLEPAGADPRELSAALVLVLVCSGIAVSAITRVMLGAAVGQPVPLGILARLTFRRGLISAILVFSITSFLSNAGLLVLVFPGLILGGLFAAALPIVLVEHRSGLVAMGRSAGLMRQDLMKAMAAFSFGALVSELLPLGLLLALQSIAGPSPFSPLLAVLVNGATLPVSLAVNVALYCSVRVMTGANPDALRRELMHATSAEDSASSN
jgi:hypothetical protein